MLKKKVMRAFAAIGGTSLILLLMQRTAQATYDATVPTLVHSECINDHCGSCGYSDGTPACSAMSGCAYSGSALASDPCSATGQVDHLALDEKHYRIS